jgi:NAD(P)-dependent dehydrogenase (short-subunit alcohol dehydrogenase family)
MQIRERVAIVTGASGGIGAPTVRALALRGAHVVVSAPASEIHLLEQVAADAEGLGVRALVVPADVSRREDVDLLVKRAVDQFGTVDILVNVAGISSGPSICDNTDADLERVIVVNLLGCARTMHAVLPIMKAQRRGAIVNVGSVAGEAGVLGVYSASKFGLRGLSDTVRREVRSCGVSVSLIEPGFVRTPLNAAMGDGLPPPEIVANAIARAIERPKRRVIVPWYYTIPVYIANVFPGFIDRVFGDARIQVRLNRDSRAERAAAANAEKTST